MKKSLILLAAILIALVSCSVDDKLIKDAERFLKSQLNDPESYERISFTKDLVVTVSEQEQIDVQDNIYDCKKEIERVEISCRYYRENPLYPFLSKESQVENDLMVAKCNKTIDSLKAVLIQRKQDSITVYNKPVDNKPHRIVFRAEYRAKNSFGALVIENSVIVFYPQTNEYDVH